MNKTLIKDAERMEEVIDKLADRKDIWQDRYIYWIAVAIYHIILDIRRRDK